jgi:hypothetical protein
MKPIQSAACCAILLLAGCAYYNSYTGSGLVPGKSTASDVQAQMGPPAERLSVASGNTIWYYPRGATGTQTYAVRLSSSGVVQSVDKLLEMDNLKKLVPGTTTTAEVREQFGPPEKVNRFDRQQRNVWEYRMSGYSDEPYFLDVQFSDDGIVREVYFLKDMYRDQGGRRH